MSRPSTKLLLCLVGAAFVLASATTVDAARRTVLFEENTNWGCPPCLTANPVIHDFLEDYSTAQVVAVKWHVWWPAGNDPFYLYNTSPVQTRIGYYGINAAPDVVVDGTNGPVPGSYGSMQAAVEARLALDSPLAITTTGTLNVTNFDVSIDIDVETAQVAADTRMFCVLAEHHKFLPSPNGETDHYDIFRQTIAETGQAIDLTTTGVQHFDFSLPYDSGVMDAGELQAVVWVQNYSTREVIQAATTWPKPQHYIRVAGGTPGVVNGVNETAVFTRDVINLGQVNDVFDIDIVQGLASSLPAGWTWQYTTSQGTFSGPSSLPLNVGEGETMTVEISSNGVPGGGLLELSFTSQGDPGVSRIDRFSKLSGPTVLVYDDDGGVDFEQDYLRGLENHSGGAINWGLWDDSWGKLTGAELATAQIVFWHTGLSYPTLDPNDRAALTEYLDGGGKLFINGQDIGWDLNVASSGNADVTWYRNNLHALWAVDHAGIIVNGIDGDPITDGLSWVMTTASQPYTDGLQPFGANVTETAFYNNPTFRAILRFDDGLTKIVYMGHGFEGIQDPAVQDLLIERIIDWFNATTGVEPAESAPIVFELSQNRPNPFNPTTSIPYTLSAPGQARLAIYDVGGRLVRVLVDENVAAGTFSAVWDGRNDAGVQVESGVYYYRLDGPDATETRSMVLVK